MEDFDRIQKIFEEVCDLPPAERPVRLRVLCGDDADLLRNVEELLRADLRSSWFLDQPLGSADRLMQDIATGIEAPLPDRIGPFRVRRLLGEGGMGVVYEAEQEHPRRLVAVKCIHPWLQTEDTRRRFRAEAQLMGQLLHPNIPQVYEAGQHEGQLYLAMERVRGHELHAWALRLDLRGRVRLLLPILDAVQHAHDNGVVHCDLKPANVLVSADGTPKVLDFGISSTRDRSTGGAVAGTPLYMCPEQLRGEAAPQPGWDVYALGVLGYELLTGRHPYGLSTRDRARILDRLERAPDPTALGSGLLADDLEAVLERAIQREPSRRYTTAAAFGEDLIRALEHRPVSARAANPAYLVRGWTKRNRSRLAVGASPLLAAGLVIGGWMGWTELEAQRAEARFDERWRSVQAHITGLEAHGDLAEAEAIWQAFIHDQAWLECGARSRAWLERGEALSEAGRSDEALEATTQAFLTARSRDDELVALRALGSTFSQRWAWSPLSATLGSLADRGATAPELALQDALGRRDLARALELLPLDDPRRPLLQALAQGVPWAMDAHRLESADLNGDGRDEIFGFTGATLELQPLGGELMELPLQLDAERALWLPRRQAAVVQSRRGTQGVLLVPLGAEQLAGVPPTTEPLLEVDGALCAAEIDLDRDGHDEIVLGTGPYLRRLYALRQTEQGWVASSPLPRIDAAASDLDHLLVADLDSDEQDELIVAATRWRAWDLRLLERHPDAQLAQAARLPGAEFDPVSLHDGPEGPRIFTVEHPTSGGAARMRLLSWNGDALENSWSAPLPLPEPTESLDCSGAYGGDLDGDGLQDLAFSCRVNGEQHAYLCRGLPDGSLATLILPGLYVTGLVDGDGDGDAELAAELDAFGEQWLLGLEGRAPPRAPVREGDGWNVPPELSQVGDLLAMGLLPAAADRAELAAPASGDPGAALRLAAALRIELEQPEQALALYDRALAQRGDDLEAERGRAQTLEALFRFEEALQAWEALAPQLQEATDRVHALRPLVDQQPPQVVVLQPGLEQLQVDRPLAVRGAAAPTSLELHALQGAGRLVWLPLVLSSPHVALTLELELSRPEMASQLALTLRCDQGDPLIATLGVGGGGGTLHRGFTFTRPHGTMEYAATHPIEGLGHRERLSVQIRQLRTTGFTAFRAWSDQSETQQLGGVFEPLGGGCTLEMGTEDEPHYDAPTGLRARLFELELRGLTLGEAPAGSAGRTLLLQGRAEEAHGRLPPRDRGGGRAAPHARGGLDEAADLAVELLRDVPPYASVVMRHVDPVIGSMLQDRLGADFYGRWLEAHRACLEHPEPDGCVRALDRPGFSAIPADTATQRVLLIHHARRMVSQGLLSRAAADLQRLLPRFGPAEAEQHAEAWLLWADLACLRGDPDEHARALERALEQAPAPELFRDRLPNHGCDSAAAAIRDPADG